MSTQEGEEASLVNNYGTRSPTLSESTSTSKQSPTPTPTSPGTSGRKPPPSPLALTTTSFTHLSPSFSVSPNSRQSLDSSRSDLTSIRSELTSLHISDFPLPPSILPTIPASPATPKSLFFTTTPTSTSITLLQEPADGTTINRSFLPSPRSLKGLFTRSNNSSQTRLVSEQVEQTQARQASLESLEATAEHDHHYSISKDTQAIPQQQGSSRAPTPTTADTMIPKDWRSNSSDGSSSLKSTNSLPFPPASRDPKSQPPTISPPPQSPLPVPPSSNRSSFRTSLRYSQILYDVGHSDMGMDITEEKLLSTDFITEMLRQPGQVSIPTSQVPPPPGITLQEAMLEKESRGKVGLQPNTPSQLTVIDETGELLSPSPYSPNLVENEVETGRIHSVLASSVFPSGADMIYYDSPLTSPSMTVPSSRHHPGSHPLVPNTPMTPASFDSLTSPKSPTTPFEPSSSSSPTTTISSSSSGRSPSVSQMVASRLPIGRSMSTTSTLTVSTQRTAKPVKIRQHRYPRSNTIKTSPNSPESVPMQELNVTSPVDIDSPTTVVQHDTFIEQRNTGADITEIYDQYGNVVNNERRLTAASIGTSAHSHATSTKTQRDSVPVIPTIENLYDFTDDYSNKSKSSLVPPHSLHSVRTRESAFDEGDVYVGIAKTVDVAEFEPTLIDRPTSPKIIGVAPARVILQPNRMGSPPSSNDNTMPLQPFHMTDKKARTDANSPSVSPISPRDPPSVPSPPSHRTDIPESAKSLVFSDEVDDVHHLPYEIRSSGGTYWTMFPGMGNNPPSQDTKSTRANAATSFKSIVSYITAKSAAKDSHKSTGNMSSKWAWLLRKPLPPLPIEAEVAGPSTLDHDNHRLTSPAIPFSHEKSKLSPPPLVGFPHGWDDIVIEKRPSFGVGLMGRMFGEDSLKIAKRKPNRKLTDPPHHHQGNITPYILPHLSGVHRRQSSTVSSAFHPPPPEKLRKRKVLFAGGIVGLIIIVVIIVLAVVLSRTHHASPSSCSNGNVGSFCNLDATCTCPSGQSGICTAPLAKALSGLIPQAVQIFNVNITASILAIILWEQNGTPVNSDCSSQAELMDLGGSLNPLSTPNRTSWAQSALIWNLFETANVNSTKQLQLQIQQMPFQDLAVDGIVPDPNGHFLVPTSGYILDFANQTVTPPPTRFSSDAAPSAQQISEINPSVESTLDRMYSFAIASSTQSQTALSQYWQNVLTLDVGNLPNFLSALRASSILLPFDATNKAISNFLSGHESNSSISFPPPIACYPGLSSSQISSINLVETHAFGLSPITSPPSTSLDPNCFINRPVYGMLDVWRLQLPFPDSRQGVAQQAVVLNGSEASVRAILHAGEMLSAFPGDNITDIHPFNVNPQEFGTLSHIQHVALRWLQSFSSVDLAIAAAEYLSQSPTQPPPSASPLLNATMPVIEVAFFGEVLLQSDISSFVSDLTTPTGELFFGSSQGEAFRRWALQQSSSPSTTITWTDGALAQQVVIETQTVNSKFENVWTASGNLITHGPTNSSSVQLVVNTFRALGLFSN